MYYGSYRYPRVLVWVIGAVILVLMMGIGFLGYLNSPKWFNINIFIISVYINYDTIYYILNIINYNYNTLLLSNKNYNKYNNKSIYVLNKIFFSYEAAVKKYKLKNFSFIAAQLELFPEIVTQENNKDLLNLEDKYLKLLLPNYNILTEAGSSFGYKHTEIDRKKMQDLYSDERRERIGRHT